MESNMKVIQPQNAKGTRDFGPIECTRRKYIFDIIEKHFSLHGFMPLQTPSMENIEVLTGKYGEEGDKLLFKILNSGDFLSSISESELAQKDSRIIGRKITEKGLRYDLTVPFARYVAKNQNEIAFPFKRYQIQPVWRADRPQKGRYREFYQCDADIIGSDSLLCDAELMQIYHNVFAELGIDDISIKFNNRKILVAISEILGERERLTDITIAIDKLDKIGKEKVFEELKNKNFNEEKLKILNSLFEIAESSSSNFEKLTLIEDLVSNNEVGAQGVGELKKVFTILSTLGVSTVEFDPTLARGLDYYTGSIYEVKLKDGAMGSIGAGGRYDDLTSLFGVKDLSGIGISFGAERIYDIMLTRNLFADLSNKLDYLIINFDENLESDYFLLANKLRSKSQSCEVYPSSAKLKKQMSYADKRGASQVIFYGESEKATGMLKVKNLATGEEKLLEIKDL